MTDTSHAPQHQETKRDEALKESFPASDPPSTTPPQGSRKAEQDAAGEDVAGEPQPKGLPTSDRHASETAHTGDAAPHATHTKPM